MRRNTLQVCQDYLEFCTYEEGIEPIHDATCDTFCQKIELETANGSTDYFTPDTQYESNLRQCREARERYENGESNEHEQAENVLNGDVHNVENDTGNIDSTMTSNTETKKPEETEPTILSNIENCKPENTETKKPEETILSNIENCKPENTETTELREYSVMSTFGKYNTEIIISILGIFNITLLVLLWDSRRSYSQLKAQMDIQNDLLKKQYNLLLEKKKLKTV